MPSPQKQVAKPVVREGDSDSSDSECEGLLERDFDGVNALESMLLSELFDHFVSLGGLLAGVEEHGGQHLATTLAYNEKITTKVNKFIDKHVSENNVADGYVSVVKICDIFWPYLA